MCVNLASFWGILLVHHTLVSLARISVDIALVFSHPFISLESDKLVEISWPLTMHKYYIHSKRSCLCLNYQEKAKRSKSAKMKILTLVFKISFKSIVSIHNPCLLSYALYRSLGNITEELWRQWKCSILRYLIPMTKPDPLWQWNEYLSLVHGWIQEEYSLDKWGRA